MRPLGPLACLGLAAALAHASTGCGGAPVRSVSGDGPRADGPPVPVALRLVHRADEWPVATRLAQVTLEIDGTPVATRAEGELPSGEPIALYEGALARGTHRLRVVIAYALSHRSAVCHYGAPTGVRAELDHEIVVGAPGAALCVRTGRESLLEDALEALRPRIAEGDPRCAPGAAPPAAR